MKKVLLIVIALILLFAACTSAPTLTVTTLPPATPSASAAPGHSERSEESLPPTDDQEYIFYTTKSGLYRANSDGTNKKLIDSIDYPCFDGIVGNFIYYDGGAYLYKIDIDGNNKQQITTSETDGSIIVNGILYFVILNKLYKINAMGGVEEIPINIPGGFRNFASDKNDLYICSITGNDSSDIYKVDLENNKVKSIMKNLSIEPRFIINDGILYIDYRFTKKSEIVAHDINTGKEQTLFEYQDLLTDMSVFNRWLLYITQDYSDNKYFINGYNIDNKSTFRVSCFGNIISEVLNSEVLIYNTENDSMSILTINNGNPIIEPLKD